MTTDSEVTLGELSRSLASLEGRLHQMFGDVNRRLDNLQFVTRDVYDLQVKQLNERIGELEDARRWTTQTLVVSFLFPLIVAALIATVVTR